MAQLPALRNGSYWQVQQDFRAVEIRLPRAKVGLEDVHRCMLHHQGCIQAVTVELMHCCEVSRTAFVAVRSKFRRRLCSHELQPNERTPFTESRIKRVGKVVAMRYHNVRLRSISCSSVTRPHPGGSGLPSPSSMRIQRVADVPQLLRIRDIWSHVESEHARRDNLMDCSGSFT